MATSKEQTRSLPGEYRTVFDAACVADPSGSTLVTIRSSLVFGVVDWGRNQKNVDRLFARIEAVLADPRAAGAASSPAASGGAWHPGPSGRHELRWWDGTAWTPHVSDGGVTSIDPT